MIAGRIMHFHAEEFGQRPEESRDEFLAPVAGYMTGDTVFGKDVNKEELGETGRGNMNVAGDKNNLLGRTITNDEDTIVLTRKRKLFNEVHGDRMPRMEGYRKWSQQSVRAMPRSLVAFADDTRLAVVPDERPELRPSILPSDEG
jgi:hypothetical protein